MNAYLVLDSLHTPLEINLTYTPYSTSSSDFWTSTIGIALIGGIFLVLGALIAGGSQLVLEREKDKILKRNNRLEACSELRGIKSKLVSYYKNILYTKIDEENLHLHSGLNVYKGLKLKDLRDEQNHLNDERTNLIIIKRKKEQPDYIESIRKRECEEKLRLEKANVDQIFWNIIGKIHILFYDPYNLDILLNNIKFAVADLDDLENEIIKDKFDTIRSKIRESSCILGEGKMSLFHDKIEAYNGERSRVKDGLNSDVQLKTKKLDSEIDKLMDYLISKIEKDK